MNGHSSHSPDEPAPPNRPDRQSPRILFITPEISQVPTGMGPGANSIRAKAGGMADVSASLVQHLFTSGADVHLAIPHYRNLFRRGSNTSPRLTPSDLANSRIHLGEDSAFYHKPAAYHGDANHLRGASLAFQREVINHIIPLVQPDIVHCNDWMTGLIPAACKKLGIKTVFTIHNIHRERTTLAEIENRGIDVFEFWKELYYENYPFDFRESYHHNAIDILSSAIQASDFITTVSPTFLQEMIHGKFGELPGSIQHELHLKIEAGYAEGILNSPHPSYDPACDSRIPQRYDATNHLERKRFNKLVLQRELGLTENPDAPLLFWPSRLDPVQKGCQLLTDILYETMAAHDECGLQLVVVGDGAFQGHFHDIVAHHDLGEKVAVMNFDESLSRHAFAAADFVLLPSSFEPCGLPQMIGMRYGTLPIVHNTGGLHDTVESLSQDGRQGNGFSFDYFTSHGLRWAIDEAVSFYLNQSEDTRRETVTRIMKEAQDHFSNETMCAHYDTIYRKLADDLSAAKTLNSEQHHTS